LAVRLAGQMDFAVFRVKRDDEFIATLIEAEEEFWTRYVIGDETPADIRTMEPRKGMRAATEAENEQAAKLHIAWVAKKRAAAQFDEAKAWMQDAIADAEGIETSEGTITWKKSKDSVSDVTDWEAVAKEMHGFLQSADPDAPTLETIAKLHTRPVTRPGSRRFVVPSKWKKEL